MPNVIALINCDRLEKAHTNVENTPAVKKGFYRIISTPQPICSLRLISTLCDLSNLVNSFLVSLALLWVLNISDSPLWLGRTYPGDIKNSKIT